MKDQAETTQTTTTPAEVTPPQTPSTPSLETSQPAATQASSEPAAPAATEPAPVVPAVAPVATEPAPAAVTPPEVAPLEEEYELELPEGSLLSDEDLNQIAEEASRLNLPKEDALKLIDLKQKGYEKGMSREQSARQAEISAAKKELLSHEDFSGEKAQASWASVSRAVETFGDQSMIELLNTPGYGDNLKLAQFLKKIGDAMAPDTIPMGGSVPLNGSQKGESDSLKRLYPDFYK